VFHVIFFESWVFAHVWGIRYGFKRCDCGEYKMNHNFLISSFYMGTKQKRKFWEITADDQIWRMGDKILNFNRTLYIQIVWNSGIVIVLLTKSCKHYNAVCYGTVMMFNLTNCESVFGGKLYDMPYNWCPCCHIH